MEIKKEKILKILSSNKIKPILIILLILSISFSGTMAFMTVKNKNSSLFTVGNVNIELKDNYIFNDEGALSKDKKYIGNFNTILNNELTDIVFYSSEEPDEACIINNINNAKLITAKNIFSRPVYYIFENNAKERVAYINRTAIYEINDISDYAENFVIGNSLTYRPYVVNTGTSDAYVFMTVELPVVDKSELLYEDNFDKFNDWYGQLKNIKVTAYAVQPEKSEHDTLDEVWNDCFNNAQLFGKQVTDIEYVTKNTDNTEREPIFYFSTINEERFSARTPNWSQIGTVYKTENSFCYIFGYSVNNKTTLGVNEQTTTLYDSISLTPLFAYPSDMA